MPCPRGSPARPVEPTVGRLLSTEAPWRPTCHGSRPTVGSTKIVVPWQPTLHGGRPAVGAKTMRRADAWGHAMQARIAARTVEPTVGRLLSTVVPWQPTCHGSRPTVGSTKLSCRGSRRCTAADQRSARRQCGVRMRGAMPCPRGSPARPVEPTVGRLLSTEVPPQPTCHGSRPTVGSTKIVVPWQPTLHGGRPAVGATTMRRADAWRHAMPARFAGEARRADRWSAALNRGAMAADVSRQPTNGRLYEIVVPWRPTCHGSRPTVGSTKIVVPWRPTWHGSRPTVGSTKLSCRGSRRGTAADQRSALPRGVVSAAA